MIKNIIFDFGGVLLDLRPDRCIEEFRRIGIPEVEQMLSVAHQQGVMGLLEEGRISVREFCSGLRADHIPAPSDRQIIQAFCSMADGLPAYKLDFLQQLKEEGYHVSALSNTNTLHWGYCQRYFIEDGYVPEELFEHLWLSCDMQMAKPDPRIFEAVLQQSGYVPEETLFVDDNPKNCEVARSFGIRTYMAPIRTDWSSELRQQLVILNE